jgi:hypothetical protein
MKAEVSQRLLLAILANAKILCFQTCDGRAFFVSSYNIKYDQASCGPIDGSLALTISGLGQQPWRYQRQQKKIYTTIQVAELHFSAPERWIL